MFEIDLSPRCCCREDSLPDLPSCNCIRERKLHDETDAAQKCRIKRLLHIGSEDCNAVIGLHLLQQIADFQIGIAVMAVTDFASFAEECVGFVKEKHRTALLSSSEDAAEVFFGFSNVFADNGRQIYLIKIKIKLCSKDLCRHGFARTACPCKEHT